MAVLTPYLDKLKSHLSIDAVVGEKVRLESKGNRMWGLCPFHAENTPSFTVSVDRGSTSVSVAESLVILFHSSAKPKV